MESENIRAPAALASDTLPDMTKIVHVNSIQGAATDVGGAVVKKKTKSLSSKSSSASSSSSSSSEEEEDEDTDKECETKNIRLPSETSSSKTSSEATSSDDDISVNTDDVLSNDPLYFVLSKIFVTKDGKKNVADVLEEIASLLRKGAA